MMLSISGRVHEMSKKIDEGKLIPYHPDMPFPQPRIALYYATQYEDGKTKDKHLYLECLEVLYKYGLRERPSISEGSNLSGVKHG